MPGSAAGPRAKIERAKHHIDDLTREVRAFLETGPYEVGTKTEDETGDKLWVITRIEETPTHIALTAGDVIHNARSALDLLIWQLVLSNNKTPTKRDAFPISNSPEEFKTGGESVIKGRVSKQAFEAIRTLQPYKGGNDGLWRLHKLDIADKHRLLLTVGSAYRSTTLPFINPSEGGFSPEAAAMLAELTATLFFKPADRGFPLQVDTELMRIPAAMASEPHTEPQFRFEVALSETQVVEGESLLETLSQIVSLAEQVTEPLLRLL